MQKLLILIVIGFFGLNLNGQEINNNQHSLVTKRTADWCPFCGSWGWTLMEGLKADLKDEDVLLLALHHSGTLATTASKAIADNIGGSGQPIFFLNEDNQEVNSSNVAAKRAEIVENVKLINGFGALAGLGAEATYLGGNVNVKTKVKFLDNIQEGQYYLGVYTLRNNVISNQANVGPNAKHPLLVDKSFNTSAFGNNIANGPLTNGTEIEGVYNLSNVSLPNSNINDLKVALILWNRNSQGRYIFFNGAIFDVNLTSSQSEVEHLPLDFDVTSLGNDIIATFNKQVDINQFLVFDVSGRQMQISNTIRNGNSYNLTSQFLTSGVYTLHAVDNDGKKLSKQFFVK